MEYISTRNIKNVFSFKDVFLKGLAPDGGLFIPKFITPYTSNELSKLKSFSYKELATEIIFKFSKDTFNKKEIEDLVNDSYKDFRVQDVVKINKLEKINLLELFHGPTLAFKDIAMQVIGNMYEKILKKDNLKINIIVATSGDTGAAAISAIKDRENIKIFVLHPKDKISEVQRKFMTTANSKNVFNIALDGNFDDCQKLVKEMFGDSKFNSSINMSGVNSINWSRIVMQIVYYFFSYFKIAKKWEKINFSVPTGNFGDIYAGYIAKRMGLPISKLIIATNKNDILKRVVNSGLYKPLKVEQTISPSMDIQISSNFERLMFDVCLGNAARVVDLMKALKEKGEFKLKKDELNIINENFNSESLSEKETNLAIKEMYNDHKILIDPHSAIGVGVLKKIPLKETVITLATAHPAKFSNAILNATGVQPELPEKVKNIMTKEEIYKNLPNDLKKIQNFILEKAKT